MVVRFGIVWFVYCVHMVFAVQGGSGPKFIQEPSDIIAQKNRPASLHCIASANPKPKITWWHNGAPIKFSSSDNRIRLLTNGTLHFSRIIHTKSSKPDEGYYQCVASSQDNRFVIISCKASLKVAGMSSRISIQPSSLQVMAGDTARFYCQIRHSLPNPVIKWKFKDSSLQPSSRYTMLESLRVLQIHNIKQADSGRYSCLGQNPVNGKEHESSHSVLSIIPDLGFPKQPRIRTKPVSTNATKGSLTVLECIVTGNPSPSISWTKDGSPVVISGHISIVGGSNLQFSPVKVSDAGLYSCQATANNNRVTATAKLSVEYPPAIVEPPVELHSRINQNVEFQCVADGNPKPVIEWWHNARLVTPGDYKKITNESLIVEEVLPPDDEGIYQCLAFNKFGSSQASAKLFVYRRGEVIPTFSSSPPVSTSPAAPVTVPTTRGWTPTAPQNVSAVALTDKEIFVRWSPPIDQRGTIKGYGIFYVENIPGGVTSDIKITSGKILSYKFTDLKPSTEYTFYVLAENEYGRGMVSDLAQAQTRDNSWAVPGPPRNVQALAVSDSSIRITWTVPATGSRTVARYVIYYKAEGEMTEKESFTKQPTRKLNDLDAYTKYFIIVYAENKHGLRSQPAKVEAVTASGVPKDAPENFVLQPASSGTALYARWSPPSYVHGKIDYYVILYRKSGTNKNATILIAGDKSTFIIRSLEENTTYEAKIAARTETGQGPFTDTWVKAKTRPGKCRVDSEPGRPHKMKATARGSVIHVVWQPPVDKADVCVIKYQLAWGPGAPGRVKKEVDNDTFQYIIGQNPEDKLRPNQQYVVKLTAWNKKGNGLDAQEVVNIENFGRPKEYLTNLEWKALSPSAVKLTWEEPLVTSSKFRYHITYILNQKTTYCGNTTNRAFNVTNLRAATHYIFNVRRNNDDYNTTVSGVTLETRPGAPVDLNGNPSETDPTQLDLHWQPPDQPNGKILMYEIRYSNNRNAKLKLWGKVGVNGSELMTTLTLTVGTKYFFKMRAKTHAGWGPYSELYTITTPLAPATQETTAVAFTGSGSDATVSKQKAGSVQDKTLWIVIAAVAGLTLVAIIIISVILCKKRSGDDLSPRKPPPKPTYKQAITANGSVKKKSKDEKRPDLWINHSHNMEMKPLNPDRDMTNTPPSVIAIRNSDPDPLIEDARKFDPERSSFSAHNSDTEGDWSEKEPMLPQYPPGHGDFVEPGEITPSPPTTPIKTYSPVTRPRTPENVYPSYQYPVTSTPRYDKSHPRPDNNPASDVPHNPTPRSYVYDADFFGSPNRGVPVYPMPQPSSGSPYRTLPLPTKPKPLVSPNDDIQIPPPTYSRQPRVPNGLSTLPPRYDDVMRRKEKSENDIAVADLEKEIAGLEGLMQDLNDITASEAMV